MRRGIRMIPLAWAPGAWATVALALSLPLLARAAPSRGIPRGELHAQVVRKAFESPRGELQFTETEGGTEHSAFLRSARGAVLAFTELRGGAACEEWFEGNIETAAPTGCEFVFYDEEDGRTLSVRSEELEESTIFDVTSGALHALSQAKGGVDVSL